MLAQAQADAPIICDDLPSGRHGPQLHPRFSRLCGQIRGRLNHQRQFGLIETANGPKRLPPSQPDSMESTSVRQALECRRGQGRATPDILNAVIGEGCRRAIKVAACASESPVTKRRPSRTVRCPPSPASRVQSQAEALTKTAAPERHAAWRRQRSVPRVRSHGLRVSGARRRTRRDGGTSANCSHRQ